MRKYNNKSWYSVILALLMTWFMLVLTTWVFSLVLRESKDTKAMENYLKAFAWAEWSLELAMLKSKNYSYSIDHSIPHDINDKSIVLAQNPLQKNLFHKAKDVFISYDMNSLANDIDKDLWVGKFDIIPLFSYDSDGNLNKITNLSLSTNSQELVWNIVWESTWISWMWDFVNSTNWNYKTISWVNVSFSVNSVWNFLNNSNKNYLIIHNASSSLVNYNLRALNSWEYFTNFLTNIIASWEIWWFKQNIKVNINSSEYLNLLKYSIFSNN